ncbi:erythroblast NAD(P)(+)--arginine ADP-ribosyltransferase-like [Megalops cyprinoides]|uniref:erythroblast NAD(P)(+)--arginine ADP-ribosyltransferase-like n=1 Tax=Megalops cyprinoides TaxID=118141 RepID=UPI0018649FB3|nr:erythroblast NAD(P)(+)--arginine ADP-ribosyltransferase-like [Megalops cyprinoides]
MVQASYIPSATTIIQPRVTVHNTESTDCIFLSVHTGCALLSVLQVTSEERQMSMSPSAVDDQFSGCRAEMWEKVMGKGGLLEQELQGSSVFQKVWSAASCSETIPGGRLEHTLAMEVYSRASSTFRKEFNSAVESRGANSSVYRSSFPFKSLHFLLTEALQLLKPNQSLTTYRGSQHQYKAEVGTEVRFGRFTSTREERSHAEEDADSGTLFVITSRAAVSVEKPPCATKDIEFLIPPFEVFKVESVEIKEDYTEITLNHTRFHSYHDCYLFPRWSFTDRTVQQVTSEERQMSMSPSAVDDRFSGCRAEMREKVMGRRGLLEQELQGNSSFQKVWSAASCSKPIPGGRLEHARAIEVYSCASSTFRKEFNSEVESQGGNSSVYSSSFPFKSLHFLLTEALQLLKPNQSVTTYREKNEAMLKKMQILGPCSSSPAELQCVWRNNPAPPRTSSS